MKNLWHAGRELLLDFVATIAFLLLYWLTKSIWISVAAGLALAFAQAGWQLIRHKAMDAMQWVSLVLVVMAGITAVLTNNPVFVLLKPSAIYIMVGVVMLKRGWMMRYVPPDGREWVPDMAITFGYVWAGLMFVSAAVNVIVALNSSVAGWVYFMSVYGMATKLGLFAIQFSMMRMVGRRRYRQRQGQVPA